MKITPEIMNKAKRAQSASELMHMAHESGMAMTADEAQRYFDMLHPAAGVLSDDELDNVSGGGCGGGGNTKDDGTTAAEPEPAPEPAPLFEIGELVLYKASPDRSNPCTVLGRYLQNGREWRYTLRYRDEVDPDCYEYLLMKYD